MALEFSSAQRSVALARGGQVLAETSETGGRGMNAFGLIEKALASAKMRRDEIEVIAVGLGPGSYTGIRAALSIAQGWQLARNVKLIGISSAECLVSQAQAEKIYGRVNVVVDAQRGEFYFYACEISTEAIKETVPLKIVTAAQVEACLQAGEILIGPEVTRWFRSGKPLFPLAGTLAQLASSRGAFTNGGELAPLYLRETNFLKMAGQRKA